MSSTTGALMMSEFNHLPFFLVSEDYWNVAEEMLEMATDAETDTDTVATADETEYEDDEDGAVGGGGGNVVEISYSDQYQIDTLVFYYWSYVVTELVEKLSS